MWASLYRISGLIGSSGLLAAGAFLAYLIGAVLAVRVVTVNAHEAPKTFRFWESRSITPPLSRLALEDLTVFLRANDTVPKPDPQAELSAEGRRGQRDVVNLAVRKILGETRQLRTKLLLANADLFNEYDRAVAEAEFRKNVAIAASGLGAVLIWLHSPLWGLLFLFTVRLYRAGVVSERGANEVIVQAVVSGLVTPATLSEASGVPAVPAGSPH
ncbi:hypothetical protein OH768_25540 [Streptomyces sp. NBC_01622]|uniref:hypothetical protein n=1 Tax=Streptomyces sp. NBC_01622 TaxID=2975903 RepID=UPI00386753FF|nr:hypothetical protein OH768_25540 [Streptomyces sp. NBC_01622]